MADLSVLIPDSTCPADVDRFCELVRVALVRSQTVAPSPAGAVSVEFLGVPTSSPQSDTDSAERSSHDEALFEALARTMGHFAVWVPDPRKETAATQAVNLFARRRELPVFWATAFNTNSGLVSDADAQTQVSELQTSLQTQVDGNLPVCVVLGNRFLSRQPSADTRFSRLWIDHEQGCSERASEADVASVPEEARPKQRTLIRVRSIIAATLMVGTAWCFWGPGSSMTAATGTPGQPDSTAGNSNSPGSETAVERPFPDSTTAGSGRPNNDQLAPAVADPLSANTIPPTGERDRQPVARATTVSNVPAGNSANNFDISPDSTEERLLRDATYLASDDLEGRGVRTQGLEQAAEFLARQFADAGLNTSHYNGTPFQEFELLSLGGDSPVQQLAFRGADGTVRRLTPHQDFASLLLSRSSKLEVAVAFAGFGISAPEVGYDDYQGLDVADKAVVVLRHAPKAFGSEANDLARHSYIRTKIAAASARGASAVLLCSDLSTVNGQSPEAAERNEERDKLLRVELALDDGIRPIPVIHCRRDVLADLLSIFCSFHLDAVERRITTDSKPSSQNLEGLTVTGHVSQLRRGRTLKNVVATLDPPAPTTGEAIIVGAHYDHLGRGGWGSLTLGANNEIHNGADDNASGTAVMLEVARQLAAVDTPLPRRIVFAGFSAEELGLIGSRKYVKDPLVPIDKSIAMLNLDMVGRLRNERLTVYGTASSKIWGPLLETLAPRRELSIISKPSGYGPSDHASFYEAGVPVLHFFTGFHPQYHRPEDDVKHLNIEGMRRIASLVVDLVTELAMADERPSRSLASQGNSLSDTSLGLSDTISSNRGAAPPTLGIVPASRRNGQAGVIVQQTVSRSPADLHGIRTGDVIVRVGDNRIETIEQLVTEVRAQSGDDKLPIELVRNGIRMEVHVQF